MRSKPSKIVLDWLKKADSDFGFAQVAFNDYDDFYSQMCLLCHDAVEKYLKAYLVYKKRKYKRIHDLVTLLEDCAIVSNSPEEFKDFDQRCRILNNYYTPLKYPSHFPFAKKKQAKEAIEIAKDMGNFIKDEIK
ncbi:MAG: HEPN domain-containing protein [bacterium]